MKDLSPDRPRITHLLKPGIAAAPESIGDLRMTGGPLLQIRKAIG